MKKTILAICFLGITTTGCISNFGQYRGVASGIEIHSNESTTKINISGDASVVIAPDGSITATSKSNATEILGKALSLANQVY